MNNIKLDSFKKKYFTHAKKHALYKNILKTNGNIVFGKGSDSPKIVFIGEAPGQNENKQGKPFVGRSGKLLDKWIINLGLKETDYRIINVVPIIPLNKANGIRPPSKEEINYFFPITIEYLSLLNPIIIVLLGKSAASIFDKSLKVGETKKTMDYSIFFIYHPSYYIRRGGKGFEDTLDKLKVFLEK
ncbi:MAG: uracil-DNA glycosylase [Candidatus ainarchaeum sp.]|nr:uracil-DNA glycosylase [Candidatus ainarchaeum sp.]